MDVIYKQIGDHLKAELPELRFVDLFNDQFTGLEAGENNEYPIPLPAILIEFGEIEWTTKAKFLQEGSATIRFHIGQQLYQDTYVGSAQQTAALEILALRKKVFSILQGFRGTGFTPLIRKLTSPDAKYGNLHIYVEEYSTIIRDTSAYADRDKVVVTPGLKVEKEITP